MTDEETVIALGLLAMEAREAIGKHRLAAAEEIGISYKTLSAFEKAENIAIPSKASRRVIETYYGWRQGVIEDIWNRRREIRDGDLTLEDMLSQERTGVLEARHLTDEQLINELTFRLIMKNTQ